MKGRQKWSKSEKNNWLAKSRNCAFGVFISFVFISFVFISFVFISFVSFVSFCSLRCVLVDDGLMAFDLSRHLSLLFVNRLA